MAAAIDFWFDLGSTYSYLTAMRIDDAAAERGVAVRWRPFLLGPIFKSQGWDTSPFNLYPTKGRYMWRDLERLAAEYGLPLKPPTPFPQNSVLPARVVLSFPEAERPAVARAIFSAEFGEGRDVSGEAAIRPILAALGHDPDTAIGLALSDANKLRLREETQAAADRGVFGAPTFVTADGDLYWGNDRMERALDAALRLAAA